MHDRGLFFLETKLMVAGYDKASDTDVEGSGCYES
jgi:hypothetical protein